MRASDALRSLDARRKLVHVGCGLIALSFRWLSWPQALALALAALAFNALVLPRIGGRALHREEDEALGFAPGILLYPLSVALLVAAWGPWRGLLVPAMGWALLAFGDGAASLVGMRWGRRPLPWTPRKSWEGLVAHVVAGGAAAWAVGAFVSGGRAAIPGVTLGALAVAAVAAALASALLESLTSGIDDNLKVPLGGALVGDAALILAARGAGLPADPDVTRALAAAAACAALAVLSWWRGSLTPAGAVTAALLGTGMAAWGGWGAFATLCAFFALGVSATRLGRAVKEARGIAEARGGRRGFGNVVANGGMALLCALHAAQGGFGALAPARDAAALPAAAAGLASTGAVAALVALVAALATAAFDTVSSEVGKAYGRTTVLVTTLRRVPPGTEGAVSLEGTLAGVAGAALVGLVGIPWTLGWERWPLIPLVVVPAAFVGTTFESVVGATFERRGHRLHNDLLNFANTLVGAVAAAALFACVS